MFWKPGQKSRPVVSTYVDDATQAYEAMLAANARDAMGDIRPHDGPCVVEVIACFAPPKSWSKRKRAAALAGDLRHTSKPDGDNIVKMLDALNKIVWTDDAHAFDVRVTKRYSAMPRLDITIYPMESQHG